MGVKAAASGQAAAEPALGTLSCWVCVLFEVCGVFFFCHGLGVLLLHGFI